MATIHRGPKIPDDPQELPPPPGIQVARGLVQRQDLGPHGKDCRQSDFLLLPGAQAVRFPVFKALHPHRAEGLRHAGVNLLPREGPGGENQVPRAPELLRGL